MWHWDIIHFPPPPASSPSVKGKRKRSATEVVCGSPFRPDGVYDLLNKIQTSLSTKVGVVSGCDLIC